MATIREISQSYVEHYATHHQLQERAEQKVGELERKLQRAKDKRSKVYASSPSWIDEIIEPIAKELCARFPGYHYEVLGPYGLGAAVTIRLLEDGIDHDRVRGENNKGITFEPVGLKEGKLVIRDVSVDTGKFKPGTIGELNGMNHPLVQIPEDAGIDWLLQYVK